MDGVSHAVRNPVSRRVMPRLPVPVTEGQQIYAALDLGTNNCRLLVAVPDGAGFRVVDAFSRIVRLGEGVSRTGALSEAAMNRAVAALAVCREKMLANGVTRSRLIATEACRVASNGVSFLERVRREVGIELEIVDRGTEARLAVEGCVSLFDRNCKSALLFDIGGGSTELAFIEIAGHERPRISSWVSLPVGVVSVSERHGGHNVTPESFAAMVEEVSCLIDAFPDRQKVLDAARAGSFHLLGTSGTVTTVAGIHLGLRHYDRRRVDGLWMQEEDVTSVVGALLELDLDGRISNPCIGRERADLVLAGCAILEAIRDAFPARRLRVADRGLREGILIELMRSEGMTADAGTRKRISKRRRRRRAHLSRGAAT